MQSITEQRTCICLTVTCLLHRLFVHSCTPLIFIGKLRSCLNYQSYSSFFLRIYNQRNNWISYFEMCKYINVKSFVTKFVQFSKMVQDVNLFYQRILSRVNRLILIVSIVLSIFQKKSKKMINPQTFASLIILSNYECVPLITFFCSCINIDSVNKETAKDYVIKQFYFILVAGAVFIII